MSGLSIRTLNNIENARRTSYDGSTVALLERGLQWEPGSVEAILAGGEPTPVQAIQPRSAEELEGIIKDLTNVLERFRRWRRDV